MRVKAIAALMIVAGLINFAPLLGIVSASRLENLYGIAIVGSDLEILLRHRALLFGIVGGFMLCAAFKRTWQPPAFAMGFVSMLGYLGILMQVGTDNASLQRIAAIDLIGLVSLGVGFVLYTLERRAASGR